MFHVNISLIQNYRYFRRLEVFFYFLVFERFCEEIIAENMRSNICTLVDFDIVNCDKKLLSDLNGQENVLTYPNFLGFHNCY